MIVLVTTRHKLDVSPAASIGFTMLGAAAEEAIDLVPAKIADMKARLGKVAADGALAAIQAEVAKASEAFSTRLSGVDAGASVVPDPPKPAKPEAEAPAADAPAGASN